MRDDGITLAELIIVVSIIGILTVAVGFSFEGWMGTYRIESQIKELYSDLMEARTRAMTWNRMHFVVLNISNYVVYEDTNDNAILEPGAGGDNPVPGYMDPGTLNARAKMVQYDLGWAGTIEFDTRGLSSSAAAVSVPVALPPGIHPDYDCILVYQSRIRIGQMSGGICVYK
jgi:type II secretory pathway pseudopilin PulG